jgi:DNA recombination-dependent growth factor C
MRAEAPSVSHTVDPPSKVTVTLTMLRSFSSAVLMSDAVAEWANDAVSSLRKCIWNVPAHPLVHKQSIACTSSDVPVAVSKGSSPKGQVRSLQS